MMMRMPLDYSPPPEKHKVWRAGGYLLLAILIAVIASLFIPNSGAIYTRAEDVDIRTGRIRRTTYVLSFRAQQKIQDSPISRTIAATQPVPDWRRVNTFDGGSRVSPHHAYHSAIAQMRELEQCWTLVPFTEAAKRQSAQRVLELWQAGRGDDAADAYVHKLGDLVVGALDAKRTSIDASDLPPPP